jgi:hypothetical protein
VPAGRRLGAAAAAAVRAPLLASMPLPSIRPLPSSPERNCLRVPHHPLGQGNKGTDSVLRCATNGVVD